MAQKRKLRVFLDSNVWFSALYTNLKGSYPSIIIELAKNKVFDLFISSLVELELRHNVKRKIPDKMVLLEHIIRSAKKVEDIVFELDIIKGLPEKDRIILCTAIYHGMDFFITGNTRDFSYLLGSKIGKTLILTPKDFCLLK